MYECPASRQQTKSGFPESCTGFNDCSSYYLRFRPAGSILFKGSQGSLFGSSTGGFSCEFFDFGIEYKPLLLYDKVRRPCKGASLIFFR